MFRPTLPSIEDWLRDPLQSWGRITQAVNYAIDVHNVTKSQIPVLRQRVAAFKGELARFPASAARQALLDQIARHERAIDALMVQQTGLQGKLVDMLAQLRGVGQQMGQVAQYTGIGAVAVPVVVAAIAAVGLVLTGVLNVAAQYQARKLESESLGAKLLDYAKQMGLTPAEIQQVGETVAKQPRPKDTPGGGIFGQLGDLVPIVLGVATAIFLGPPLLKALGAATSRRGRA